GHRAQRLEALTHARLADRLGGLHRTLDRARVVLVDVLDRDRQERHRGGPARRPARRLEVGAELVLRFLRRQRALEADDDLELARLLALILPHLAERRDRGWITELLERLHRSFVLAPA